jgi:hypothetical protein
LFFSIWGIAPLFAYAISYSLIAMLFN